MHPRLQLRTEEAAGEHGEASAAVAAAARRTLTLNMIELTVLLLIVVDMAVKPGL